MNEKRLAEAKDALMYLAYRLVGMVEYHLTDPEIPEDFRDRLKVVIDDFNAAHAKRNAAIEEQPTCSSPS